MATPTALAAQIGGPADTLSESQIREFISDQLAAAGLDGRSVCVLVPDATRSCPLPLLMSAISESLSGRVTRLTVLVALGTHAAMSRSALASHIGVGGAAGELRGTAVLNHEWWDSDAFAALGTISGQRIAELSGGLLHDPLQVRVNRAVVEHDVTLIVGPVFPHEVVGFSGGNKYLFPGVSGREVIDLSHWLGALITSANIIGTLGVTPVRALIDEAAGMVPSRRLALCVVTGSAHRSVALRSMAFGQASAAWAAAARISAQAHIRYLQSPVDRVLSLLPRRYDDIWTGAKGFYKVEPIVADGGQVVIYAPHITEISAMHPDLLEIGYHCRDYFVKQWDRFKHYHWGDLAHSTHLRGAGTFDPEVGERPRVTVTLATGIPEAVVRRVKLDYLDPRDVDIAEWTAHPNTLVVPDAGEDLYRIA